MIEQARIFADGERKGIRLYVAFLLPAYLL